AGAPRRRVRPAVARHRRADGAPRAEGQGGGDRRRRPRADIAQSRSDRHRAQLSAAGRNAVNRRAVLFAPAVLLTGCATADRDHAAFASFLAEETVFLMGGKPLRGKRSVADYWQRFY